MQVARARLRFALLMITVIAFVPAAMAQHYLQTNLVSDIPGLATFTDPDLVNAWGIARGPTSPWWVNDNGTGKSTLYNDAGVKQGLIVSIPPLSGSSPTGMVFNGVATDFLVDPNVPGSSAHFIFATEDGVISGWNSGTAAVTKIDNSGSGAVYKGLAIGTFNNANYIYATNFVGGKVEVYDSSWSSVTLKVDQFVDPKLPHSYHPFNVQNIGGNLIVTFAKFDGSKDEVHGRGFGFVDEFDTGGNLIKRFQHGPWLNAPWGVALAPAHFGKFSHHLLVGQFGSGQIAAYEIKSGEFEGRLHGRRGVLAIDGLWALAFGSGLDGTKNGPANTLFFTAGPNDEENGLFGTLTAIRDDDDDHDRD
jgi:uncharacterized protein (TIGR03118 family)